jgi:hypothetical protein
MALLSSGPWRRDPEHQRNQRLMVPEDVEFTGNRNADGGIGGQLLMIKVSTFCTALQ